MNEPLGETMDSMTKDKVRALAIANGFTLREQPDGTMDINPYVYDFAAAICHRCADIGDRVVYRGNTASTAIRDAALALSPEPL